MNKYLIFILFFLYSFFHFAYIANSKEINGKARIIDGDSVEINNHMIRLIGIDAFEIKQECWVSVSALVSVVSAVKLCSCRSSGAWRW